MAAMYEGWYRQWSQMVHASAALRNISSHKDGSRTFRPLRSPLGLKGLTQMLHTLSILLALRLCATYATTYEDHLRNKIIRTLRPQFDLLPEIKVRNP